MPLLLGPYDLSALTVGETLPIPWGDKITPQQQVGFNPNPDPSQQIHIQWFNESGLGLSIASNRGRDDFWPAGAWPLWTLTPNETALTLTVVYAFTGAQVSKLVGVLYQPGEPVPATPTLGNSPVGLGGPLVVAGSVVNDGQPLGTNVIESTPAGEPDSFVLFRNDGTVSLKAISNGVETTIFSLTPGDATHAARLLMTLVQIIGALSIDNGQIVTDGSGDMEFLSGKLQWKVGSGPVIFNLTAQNDVNYETHTWSNFAGTTAAFGHRFHGLSGGALSLLFDVGGSGGAPVFINSSGQFIANSAAFFTGGVFASAPSVMSTGHQFSGFTGLEETNGAAGVRMGRGEVFPLEMTNTPTSITFSVVSSTNVTGSPAAANVSQLGFSWSIVVTAAGHALWYGTYQTVGNCLLAVDSAAATFDHHCDGCKTVRQAIPLAELQIDNRPGLVGMSYLCPCGTGESFTCSLSAADELDTTPQGEGAYATTRGAQAQLIRQLVALVGLPLRA